MVYAKFVGMGVTSICILFIMANATANVAFKSNDFDIQNWNVQKGVNTIVHMNQDIGGFRPPNECSLEIRALQGASAWITSHRITGLVLGDSYTVDLEFYIVSVESTHYCVNIFNNRRIYLATNDLNSLNIYYAYNGQKYYDHVSVGTFDLNAWNHLFIYDSGFNGINVKINDCENYWIGNQDNSYNSMDDPSYITLGCPLYDPFGAWGHSFFDSIRINDPAYSYHSPTINDYAMFEDFSMGKIYSSDSPKDATDFWLSGTYNNGIVQTTSWTNKDDFDYPNHAIYVNCPKNKIAWAGTPIYNNNPGSWSWDTGEYWISCWFYVDDPYSEWFHVIYDGRVRIVTSMWVWNEEHLQNEFGLLWVTQGNSGKICNINPKHWYRLNVDVKPGDSNPGYYVYLDNQKVGGPYPFWNIDNNMNHINIGVEEAFGACFGEMWWDDIRIDT